MNIRVLDCTLRDGGYCNQWQFGKTGINKIIDGLLKSRVEIVELGFLTNRVSHYNMETTKFNEIEQVDAIIPEGNNHTEYVVMINYGEYDLERLPEANKTKVSGIRVAFHKKDIKQAIEFCRRVKERRYKLYMQPMVTMNYTDKEFLQLLDSANEVSPDAFYIVDSFGTMKKKDLIHYIEMARVNLSKEIVIGFHSHNNLQMAFSNAQTLVEYPLGRDVLVDASIHGMGRGAGNLNLELFLDYLNEIVGQKYDIRPLTITIDDVISRFYRENPWGYSLANYLSAIHLVHPNYAIYFSKKDSLTIEAMDTLFSNIEQEKKAEFDKEYAEQLYIQYMSRGQDDETRIDTFKNEINGRKILLAAPGKSIEDEQGTIKNFCKQNNPIVICINHNNRIVKSDYLFISNMRRFRQCSDDKSTPLILTSNVYSKQEPYMIVKYSSLLNGEEYVNDNAGLMAIKFLINLGVKSINLAGYDGYTYDNERNYDNRELVITMTNEQKDGINHGMKKVLEQYKKEIDLTFVTKSRFA